MIRTIMFIYATKCECISLQTPDGLTCFFPSRGVILSRLFGESFLSNRTFSVAEYADERLAVTGPRGSMSLFLRMAFKA